ncbi:MAG: S-methyl-5-thioribose-1-phosphate isomerase [Candidatus Aenigmatarchaeota archaeon]
MNVNGKHYRTIWVSPDSDRIIQIIDQRQLPYSFVVEDLRTVEDVATAIRDMHIRGAGLIGATAGYGMYVAALECPYSNPPEFDAYMKKSGDLLKSTRPTAVNLAWAVDRQMAETTKLHSVDEKIAKSYETAKRIADEDAECCRMIGEHGVKIIEEIYNRTGQPVRIGTHCNAGWLAFVDYGTATSPIYKAQEKGIPVFVWVDETRPRNQGSKLTAWEMEQQGVPHKVIADNAGGHLMQHGMVDMFITGTDRTTRTGDVANKIGTYLKALAAKASSVPFYVALPSSTFDWNIRDGVKEIPIEERGQDEVKYIEGLYNGAIAKVLLTPERSQAANYGFDVTPRYYVTGLITERGICEASEEGILKLFPEHR